MMTEFMKKRPALSNFPQVSLVIPCYNEEQRIVKGIKQLTTYLKQQSYRWEIILVDDGSSDNTYTLARKLLQKTPHQLLRHLQNRGKGAAIRTGIISAKGKYLIFTDIDMSTPITQLPKLLTSLKTHEVVIGVRRHPQSHVLVHQPKVRESLGHLFTKLTNLLVMPGIYDFTCGFKGFQKAAARQLFTRMKTQRWAFDAEILFLARKYGFKIAQIPVVWRDEPATKVNLWPDGLWALIDLLKIRLDDFVSASERS